MGGKLMYLHIEQEIRNRILSGLYAPESQLPTENELSAEFGVSRLTVSKSLSNLVQEGLISRTRGRGSFVMGKKPENPAAHPKTAPGIFKFISPPSSQSDDALEHNQLLEGMTAAVRQQGFNVGIDFFSNIDEELKLLKEYDKPLNDGFVIWPMADSQTRNQLEIMRRDKFPFVQIDNFFHELDSNYLLTDSVMGAGMIVRHLYDFGHRRIAYLTVPLDRASLSERFAGTVAALSALRLKIDDYIGIIPGSEEVNWENLKAYQAEFIRVWLERLLNLPEPPTAIFCSNDTLAISLMGMLAEKGIRVPEAVSVAGFDNINIASWLPTPLTTLAHDFYRLGFLAGKILLQQQKNYNELPIQYRVPPKLIVRKSTGAAAER